MSSSSSGTASKAVPRIFVELEDGVPWTEVVTTMDTVRSLASDASHDVTVALQVPRSLSMRIERTRVHRGSRYVEFSHATPSAAHPRWRWRQSRGPRGAGELRLRGSLMQLAGCDTCCCVDGARRLTAVTSGDRKCGSAGEPMVIQAGNRLDTPIPRSLQAVGFWAGCTRLKGEL